MTTGNFAIDFAHMEQTVGTAKSQAQQIVSLLDDMNNSISKHTAEWVGGAAESFSLTYQSCRQRAESLPQALDLAAQTLRSINDGTQATENDNVKRIQSAS
jgi:WXG100 family type VII secretion target